MANAVAACELLAVEAIGLGEMASKRGHNYVTIFIDRERRDGPVLYVTPGKGKEVLKVSKECLRTHQGDPQQILEVARDMSGAFPGGIAEQLPNTPVTVDWFHIAQIFTRALDEVRKTQRRTNRKQDLLTTWSCRMSAPIAPT